VKSRARLAAGALETMPYSVLQPVKRRRRSRRARWPALLLVAAAVAAAASFAASDHWAFARGKPHHAERAAAPKPHAAPPKQLSRLRTAASQQRAAASTPLAPGTPLLLPGKPRLEHELRRPIAAPAAILVDADTGAVLWARRQGQRRPIASTTKIMTGILSIEHLSPTKVLRVNPIVPRVALGREGLRAHERVPVWKLMYGLLLFSGNDDALELAIGASGSKSRFLALMNEKARELGLRNTHYASPSGVIDQGNYSTARDLAALARYAMSIPRFRAIVRTRIAHVKWSPPTYAKTYVNKNQLLATYPGADGVKTGWTTLAGHCLVASARRGKTDLIAVVLHSPNPYGDARRLLNFGFANS
jgi:serine-type D-Ala-D-Ala carboxypeptidase (penicillin-binding protein 5/6)